MGIMPFGRYVKRGSPKDTFVRECKRLLKLKELDLELNLRPVQLTAAAGYSL